MNAESDPEAAAWERARQLRVQREEADRNQRAEREQATAATVEEARRRERSDDRRSFVLWITAFAAVGALVAVVILVVASRASDSDTDAGAAGNGGAAEAADTSDATESRLAPVGPLDGSTGQTGRRASPSLDAEAPPVIDLTGDNFDRVWRQAQVLEGWLLRHPRPELVEQIYTPGTETYDEVHGYIGDLAANGRILVVENYRIGDIELVARPSPDAVELRYTDTYEFRDLVDATTDQVLDHEVSDGQARAWTLILQRSAQGPWRVTSITPAA